MSLRDIIRAAHKGETLRVQLEAFVGGLEALPSNREDGWHPSSFCDMCARHDVTSKLLAYSDVPFNVDAKLRRIFDTGNALHDWYQNKYLGPAGLLWGRWKCSRCHEVEWGFMPKDRHKCQAAESTSLCQKICAYGLAGCGTDVIDSRGGCNHCGIWGQWKYTEVPLRYEHPDLKGPIVGHSDGLVTDAPWSMDGTWSVFELKTINARGFGMLPEPKKGHRNQAEIYGRLLQKGKCPSPEKVAVPKPERGVVFYVGKNTSEEKDFEFDLNEKLGDFLLSQPFAVDRAFKAEVLPDRHPECKSMFDARAKGCRVSSYCFGGNDYKALHQIGRKA